MDNDKKLAFIAHLTKQGLDHVAATPNVQSPDGKMSHEKKLAFVAKMAQQGLQHFDTGGAVATQGTPLPQKTTSNPSTSGGVSSIASPTGGYNPLGSAYGSVGTPLQNGINGVGQLVQGIGSAFTTQNDYNALLAPTDYTNYQNTINQAQNNSLNGYGQAQNIQGQQQQLSNQLLDQSQGGGPNPAQAALNQNTGQNIAQQAALAANQRGAGSNAGLIASQNAQQGAATQQQAVGQGATLQAQQQLAAENALANQQGIMGQQNIAEQNSNNQLFGGAASAQNAQNANNISNYANTQGINSSVAQNNANAVNSTTSGLLGGASSVLSSLFAKGGEVGEDDHFSMMHKMYYADGGDVYGAGGDIYSGNTVVNSSPQMSSSNQSSSGSSGSKSGGSGAGLGSLMSMLSHGGGVGDKMKKGGHVPGKPKVKGDSYDNDTVPALLSPGEEVIDNETMQDPGPIGTMARAVSAHIKRKNKGGKV